MEIADHAGETNGPEPAEETGARDKGEKKPREEGKVVEERGGRIRIDNQRQHGSGSNPRDDVDDT